MFQSVKLAHLELVAANVRSHTSVEEGANDDTIDGAQAYLPSTIDASAPAFAAIAAQPNVQWHRDAGTYFCNEEYYRALYCAIDEPEGRRAAPPSSCTCRRRT